jgi:hypothetical protein
VTGGEAGGVAKLDVRGALRVTSRARGERHSVRAQIVGAVVSTGRAYVTAAIGGHQMTLFVLDRPGPTPFDPLSGRVAVSGSPVRLANLTRDVLRDRLDRPRLRSRLGSAALRATVDAAPVESSSPPVRERPATAVDIAAGELTWRARESWVDYLHAAGEQGGTRTSNGAADGPAETIPPSSGARVYEFSFPFEDGWYDAASGAANIEFGGTVTYFKLIQPFNIDLDASDPEIELGGPAPRAIMRMDGRGNNADQSNRRAVVVDLDQDTVTPSVSTGPGGTTYAYEGIPGLNPAGATAWPIAGYYRPGDPWGGISVSFTVPEAGG